MKNDEIGSFFIKIDEISMSRAGREASAGIPDLGEFEVSWQAGGLPDLGEFEMASADLYLPAPLSWSWQWTMCWITDAAVLSAKIKRGVRGGSMK